MADWDRELQPTDANADTGEGREQLCVAAVRHARLILPILALGSLIFAAIVLILHAVNGPMLQTNTQVPQLLGVVSVALLSGGVVAGMILTRNLTTRAQRGEDVPVERALGALIASAALVQGPALLAAVAALLGGLPYLLITLVGCALLLVQWIGCARRLREMTGTEDDYRLR